LEAGADGSLSELRDVFIGTLGAESRKAELEGRIGRFRIRGVVTFDANIQGKRLFFVQDSSGACAVRFRAGLPVESVQAGQWVEVTGGLTLTNGLPEFAGNGFAVVGGGVMPKPLRHPFDPAKKDRRLNQWIEIEGVGRSVREGREFMVMTREGILPVWAAYDLSGSFNQSVNALVRIRGVYWEGPGPVLLLPSERFLEIQEPAPRNPFDIPAFPIVNLREQDREQSLARQVRIAGVVTCVREGFFVVQDESGGERVQTRSLAIVDVGDSVEVVGFPSEQPFGHALSDAVVRRVGRGQMPSAIELSTDEGMDSSKNGLVVTLEAVVLEQRLWRGNQLLDLQAGQRAFRAALPAESGLLPAIANGSRIRVTGVSQIESVERVAGDTAQGDKPLVASLELLLRSPTDLTVLQRPPWWTWQYTTGVIAIALGIFIGSVIWIRTLRRRVEQRTGQLREAMDRLQKETQVSATLAERDRLAGEIHDSLEQGLSAIIMQMDAAAKVLDQPEEVNRYLTMVKNMAGFSRTEVQHAVWNWQSPMLENADLATALRRIAGEISAGDQAEVIVEITGEVRALPSSVEHHLLRMGQEAITNAIKHAQPRTIRLSLNYAADRVKLVIRDDGCGFDPGALVVGSGHFGLQGLQSRAQKINARLDVSSRISEGTTIEVEVTLDTVSA
jgi:signal transduction histidine kinase